MRQKFFDLQKATPKIIQFHRLYVPFNENLIHVYSRLSLQAYSRDLKTSPLQNITPMMAKTGEAFVLALIPRP